MAKGEKSSMFWWVSMILQSTPTTVVGLTYGSHLGKKRQGLRLWRLEPESHRSRQGMTNGYICIFEEAVWGQQAMVMDEILRCDIDAILRAMAEQFKCSQKGYGSNDTLIN